MRHAPEIIFTFIIAIALPILALLSIFFWKAPSTGMALPAANLFPYVAPVNVVAETNKVVSPAKPEQKQTAAPATPQKEANVFSAAVGVVQRTSESWNDFLARFYSAPASLPATSPLGDFFVGGIASPDPFPLRDWQVPLTDVDGWGVVSTELPEDKILYEKDIFTPHPIASISKLMTALVVATNLDLKQNVVISKKAVDTEGTEGNLVVGETLTVKQLLYAMLLESSNDAAVALAGDYDAHHKNKSDTFVSAMNAKAKDLGLTSMSFQDPTGLTPANVSDAEDVAKLMFAAYQDEILRPILGTATYDTQSNEGTQHHWVSTDSLLGQMPGVVAGKTGFIDEAGQCLTVVSTVGSPENSKTIVSVVLGSSNRMQAMATLLSWIQGAYTWQ